MKIDGVIVGSSMIHFFSLKKQDNFFRSVLDMKIKLAYSGNL